MTDHLKRQIKELEARIGNASMLLADWDGYFDPVTGKGSVKNLAEIIEEAYIILQGESWRKLTDDQKK